MKIESGIDYVLLLILEILCMCRYYSDSSTDALIMMWLLGSVVLFLGIMYLRRNSMSKTYKEPEKSCDFPGEN